MGIKLKTFETVIYIEEPSQLMYEPATKDKFTRYQTSTLLLMFLLLTFTQKTKWAMNDKKAYAQWVYLLDKE